MQRHGKIILSERAAQIPKRTWETVKRQGTYAVQRDNCAREDEVRISIEVYFSAPEREHPEIIGELCTRCERQLPPYEFLGLLEEEWLAMSDDQQIAMMMEHIGKQEQLQVSTATR